MLFLCIKPGNISKVCLLPQQSVLITVKMELMLFLCIKPGNISKVCLLPQQSVLITVKMELMLFLCIKPGNISKEHPLPLQSVLITVKMDFLLCLCIRPSLKTLRYLSVQSTATVSVINPLPVLLTTYHVTDKVLPVFLWDVLLKLLTSHANCGETKLTKNECNSL